MDYWTSRAQPQEQKLSGGPWAMDEMIVEHLLLESWSAGSQSADFLLNGMSNIMYWFSAVFLQVFELS